MLPREAQTVQYRFLRRSRRLYGNQKSPLSCRSSGSLQNIFETIGAIGTVKWKPIVVRQLQYLIKINLFFRCQQKDRFIVKLLLNRGRKVVLNEKLHKQNATIYIFPSKFKIRNFSEPILVVSEVLVNIYLKRIHCVWVRSYFYVRNNLRNVFSFTVG